MHQESFHHAFAISTGVPFSGPKTAGVSSTAPQLPGGVASGILVTATLSSGITLTLTDGTTIALGNQTLGTYLRFRCTMATFAAGTCVAYA